MRQRIFITFIIALHALIGVAQSFTLQGRVTDAEQKPIEFATVSVLKQGKATMTSLKGEFQLSLQTADSVVIRISMVGYRAKTRVLRKPRGKQRLLVTLYADNTIDEIQVKGEKIETGQTHEINTNHLKTIPSANGNGVESLVQAQAGVTSHNELSSQYNVRGGSFDENIVYINNTEVYRPYLVRSGQQEGLSVINPYMVDKIDFSSGGFAAKYGDKMSSVLNITYKKLMPETYEGTVSASLLGTDIYGGFATKHVSWLNSLRYKTSRNLLNSLDTKGEYRPHYLDYQTYFHFIPTKAWQIDILGNISDNHYKFSPQDRETAFGTISNVKKFKVYFDGQEKDRFTTYSGSISISRFFGNRTKINLSGVAFYTKEAETYDIQGQYWLDQTETGENLAVGTYFEHSRNYLKANTRSLRLSASHHTDKHFYEMGVAYTKERIKENATEYEMRDSAGYSLPHTGKDLSLIYSLKAANKLDASRTEGYLQDTYRFTSKHGHSLFTLNYGIRMNHWEYNQETIVSPRVALGIIPAYSQNTTFRIATGIYYQAPFFKELRDTTTINGITYAGLNKDIKSQRSIHFIVGYDYRFDIHQRRFKFTAESYYKALNNLIPYTISNMKIVYDGNYTASGHAAGIDLRLYGEFVPGTDSWLCLSLMNTKMKIGNKTLPLPSESRYAFNLFFTDYFPGTNKWKMSLKLVLADGLPFSAPHHELDDNAFRAPAYKRVDIGLHYRLWDKEVSALRIPLVKDAWLGIECLNVPGINNINSYYWITDASQQQYAIPNYLTNRQFNATLRIDF